MTKSLVMFVAGCGLIAIVLLGTTWRYVESTNAKATSSTDASQAEITKSLRALLPHTERLDERQRRVLRAAAESCELGTVGAHSALDRDFELACLKDAAPNQMEIVFQKAQ